MMPISQAIVLLRCPSRTRSMISRCRAVRLAMRDEAASRVVNSARRIPSDRCVASSCRRRKAWTFARASRSLASCLASAQSWLASARLSACSKVMTFEHGDAFRVPRQVAGGHVVSLSSFWTPEANETFQGVNKPALTYINNVCYGTKTKSGIRHTILVGSRSFQQPSRVIRGDILLMARPPLQP